LPKAREIPDVVTAGLPTVGVRVPNHPVALALLRAVKVPLAAPSANRSMHVSPTMGDHVAASLGGAPDLILDAGPVSVGIESTVLDLSAGVPTVLRPGMISVDDLRQVLGRVEAAAAHAPDGVARPSPGMMDRHYSPEARVYVADTASLVTMAKKAAKAVVLARSAIADTTVTVWAMPTNAPDYARLLYSMLHRADAEGFDTVIVEEAPPDTAWDAVRDRLRRAAR
jgi:L-threonylcarbamoyladenylate synthase